MLKQKRRFNVLICFTNLSPNCCCQGKLILFLRKSNTGFERENETKWNEMKERKKSFKIDWIWMECFSSFKTLVFFFFFTFLLASFEVTTYSWICSSKLQNFLCVSMVVETCPAPILLLNHSKTWCLLLCAAKGQDSRWGGSLPFLSHPYALLIAKSRFLSLLTREHRRGLSVSQEPLISGMVEQRGHPQTTPCCISFPCQYINLCPQHGPGTSLAQRNTSAELPWQEERADTRALSNTAPV